MCNSVREFIPPNQREHETTGNEYAVLTLLQAVQMQSHEVGYQPKKAQETALGSVHPHFAGLSQPLSPSARQWD